MPTRIPTGAAAILTGLALAFPGCSTEAGFRSEMLTRVTFELGCPADQVTFSQLGDWSWGVSGCGKKVVYVYVPRVGWTSEIGVQPTGSRATIPAQTLQVAALKPPRAEDFVLIPLRVYLLRAHGDLSTAFAAEVPRMVEDLDRIFEPAGVYFSMEGQPQTVELPGEAPTSRSAVKDSLPAAQDTAGFRLFIVRELGANGALLGGSDIVVREQPSLVRVAGAAGMGAARVTGHLIASELGLAASPNASQLMAIGTTGVALDLPSAQAVHASATRVRGATTFEEAVRTGTFAEAVATIRVRTRGSARLP